MSGGAPREPIGAQPLISIANTPDEFAEAMTIRHRVFVREQGIPAELNDDGLDDGAIHALAWIDGKAVATGRLVISRPDTGVLARIAVLPDHRGHQLGGLIVAALENQAHRRSLARLELCPHEYLEDFYQNLGYRTVSGRHEAGPYSLITMEKRLGS